MQEGRHPNGRFRSTLSVQQLLDSVRAAAHASCPGDPGRAASVSTRRYNAGRGDAPSAQAVCARLGLGWRQALEAAFAEPSVRGHLLGHFTRRPEFEGDEALITRGLRAAARRVGAPLTAAAYDDAVEQLEAGARRRRGAPLGLPHSATLLARFGSWPAACRAAGVESAAPTGPPTRPAGAAVDILDRFICETGLLPSSVPFREWCRRRGIRLGRDARAHRRLVEEVRRQRAARGEPTPEDYAASEEIPGLGDEPPARGRGYAREEVLASLRLYGERHLPPGARARYKHYLAARARDPDLVPPSCLRRHGTFQDLCREAGI